MPEITSDQRRLIAAIKESPLFFFREVLGCEPTEQQIPIIEAVKEERRVVVKSGHSCFGIGTRVLMLDGSTKAVEDVSVGDRLMGDDSTARTVRGLARGREMMYRVTYRDGTQYVHNESHVLCLVAMASHHAYRTGDVTEVTVGDFLGWAKEKRRRHAGFRVGVEYSQKFQPVPPYILGLWLGDGCDSGADFCTVDHEIRAALQEYAERIGCEVHENSNGKNLWLASGGQGTVNPFTALLKSMALFRNKHIPDEYMRGSRAQRLQLLAGLIDTDGSQGESGSYDFIQKRKPLAEQVVSLVRSLGGHAQMSAKHVSTTFKSGHKTEGTYWRVYIGAGLDVPCRVKRKQSTHRPSRVVTRYGIKSIEPLGEGDYYGFNVDGNHRFLGADYMVLRNCGKDFLAARLALWFHVAHYPSIVICTGPTERQVRQVVWGELEAAYRQSRFPIGGELTSTMLKSDNPHHYILGFTTDTTEAYQGYHAPNVFVVVTEAPGIEPRMWPPIQSLMTAGNAKMLCIGNATFDPESEFYAMFTSKAALYSRFTLDSESSPHCSREFIAEMKQEYGEDSPVYLARVKGVFPDNLSDTLIPLGWIEKAQRRWEQPPGLEQPVTLGVDVARFGSDETVMYVGKGNRFSCIRAVQGNDLMETAGWTRRMMGQHGIHEANVRVDDTGLGGGVTDRLKEDGIKITPINFGAKAAREEDFANARSEMFWLLRERFRVGDIAVPPEDKKLLRDLSALKYKLTGKGQIALEPKQEAKKRLGHSPDRADSLALCAIPPNIAYTLANGNRAGMGILEWARQMAEDQKKAPAKKEPVSITPVASLPQAAALLEASKDGTVPERPWLPR